MAGEFNTSIGEIVITVDKSGEEDEELLHLRAKNQDLLDNLERTQLELAKISEERNSAFQSASDSREREILYGHHINALETKVRELQQEVHHQNAVNEQQQQQQQQKPNKPLGKKKFTDLSKDGVAKTKASYREAFMDQINQFGENRELVGESIILRDKSNGQQLEVNLEKHRTYEELLDDQKRRVKLASRWKDRQRVSDKGQSSLSHVGKLPNASHVKAFERELNAGLGEIQVVCLYSKLLFLFM